MSNAGHGRYKSHVQKNRRARLACPSKNRGPLTHKREVQASSTAASNHETNPLKRRERRACACESRLKQVAQGAARATLGACCRREGPGSVRLMRESRALRSPTLVWMRASARRDCASIGVVCHGASQSAAQNIDAGGAVGPGVVVQGCWREIKRRKFRLAIKLTWRRVAVRRIGPPEERAAQATGEKDRERERERERKTERGREREEEREMKREGEREGEERGGEGVRVSERGSGHEHVIARAVLRVCAARRGREAL
eukprot:127204-Pleurochrysis_carterae.AAC.1